MNLVNLLAAILIYTTNLTITEPADGEIYDGDWLTVRAIVENENEIPEYVQYSLNSQPVIQIPRLNTDWYTYMQNDLHQGCSESPGPQDATVFWTAPVTGHSHEFCSPVIVDSIVYFVSDEQSIAYALNSATGEIIWQYDVVDDVDDAVTYYEGKIYIAADSAWCLDALTGQRIWAYGGTAGSRISGTPAVGNGVAYLTSVIGNKSKVCALDTETGAEIWIADIPYYFESCITLHGNRLYVATWQGPLYALDALSGDIIWTNTDTDGGYWDSSPVIYDGVIYIGGDDGYIHSFDTEDGSLIWMTKVHQYSHIWGVEPTPAIRNGKVFIGCSFYGSVYGAVCGYDMQTGDNLWSIIDKIELHGSIGLADGLAYLGEHRGDSVYAIDQETGDIVWSYGIPGGLAAGFQSSPAITDGIMYIAATDGNLYAFGTGLKYTYLDDLFADVGSNELIVTSFDGGISVAADTISFTVTQTGIELVPSPLFDLRASPNPFSSSAYISFELSEPGYTSIQVFDLSGRLVCSLAESELGAGQHSYVWDGRNQSGQIICSGLYICRIQSGGISETRSLCLLR